MGSTFIIAGAWIVILVVWFYYFIHWYTSDNSYTVTKKEITLTIIRVSRLHSMWTYEYYIKDIHPKPKLKKEDIIKSKTIKLSWEMYARLRFMPHELAKKCFEQAEYEEQIFEKQEAIRKLEDKFK